MLPELKHWVLLTRSVCEAPSTPTPKGRNGPHRSHMTVKGHPGSLCPRRTWSLDSTTRHLLKVYVLFFLWAKGKHTKSTMTLNDAASVPCSAGVPYLPR